MCPECGNSLVPRLSLDGPAAGKLVWRCRDTACKYVRIPTKGARSTLRLKA